jgi:hypothetical protein
MSVHDTTDAAVALDDHVHDFFAGHRIETLTQDTGPIHERVLGFRVHAVAPGLRSVGMWTYVTTGCWEAAHDGGHGLEFVLATRERTLRAVELLAVTAHYHAGPPGQRLDVGHTVRLGEPWLAGSTCDCALISTPYPWGPDLETCEWTGGHARVLWVLPVTERERDHRGAHGLGPWSSASTTHGSTTPTPIVRRSSDRGADGTVGCAPGR